MRSLLSANPALPSFLLAIAVLLALAASSAGFFATAWYPAALFLLALLAVTAIALGRPRGLPRATVVAVALLFAFAGWSYLSITWAGAQGDAWDGANRAALFAIVFALFAIWPVDATGARVVVGSLALGFAGIGLVELLRADAATDTASFFIDVRFAEPAGYTNANAALLFLMVWPCVLLGSARETPAILRGTLLGGAGLLSGLALLSQSRGLLLVALPISALVVLGATPARGRALLATAAVGLGTFAVSGPVLRTGETLNAGALDAALADATRALLTMAVLLAVGGTLAALVDRRVEVRPRTRRRVDRAVIAAAVACLALGATVFVAREGDPITKVSDGWAEFKAGGLTPAAGAARFSSLGTNRYDFWMVAWDLVREHPVRGVGSENFQAEYQRRGNTLEQPRYAHSLQLGVLSQTGVVGALLLGGGLVAALLLVLRSVTRLPRPQGVTAVAAAAAFVYWLAHASVDWLWEFPGLTAPAFALLALAGAMAPRAERDQGAWSTGRRPLRVLALAATVVAASALATSLVLPWTAEREIERAARTWPSDPAAAFSALDRAARLNPLSIEPDLTAAVIALRIEDQQRAIEGFRAALARDPRTVYAVFQLGALASERGQRARSLALLRRAARLTPREPIVLRRLRAVRAGERLDPAAISAEVRANAATLGR